MSNGEPKPELPDVQPSPDDSPAGSSESPPAATPPLISEGAVPKKAAEDDPRAWGDAESDPDRDAWLREQRPPHWG